MKASYSKLKSGDWGLRISECVKGITPGTVVTVTKKDGTTKDETIGEIIWSDDSTFLCSISKKSNDTASNSFHGKKCYCQECGECDIPQKAGTICKECHEGRIYWA